MRLPSFRLVACVGGESYRQTASDLHKALDGCVLALPEGLPTWEIEAVIQAVVLLAARPLANLRAREGLGRTLVHPEPMSVAPEPVAGLTQICQIQSGESSIQCALPPELVQLRNAALDIYSQMSELPDLQALNADAIAYTDSPGTAEIFLDAVMHASREPTRGWGELRLVGLAAVVGRLLSDVSPEVATWVLLEAAGLPGTEPLAGRAALALGREEGLRRALHAGLALELSPIARLRPALGVFGELLQPEVDRPRLLAALRSCLERGYHPMLDRLAPAPNLRLGAPPPARHLLGRDEERQRLMAWLQPGRRVPTVVVQGSLGSGKTSLALEMGQNLKDRLETVWLDFTHGGAAAWRPVATALDLGAQRADEEEGVPPWVARCHEVLRSGPYLIVADNVDGMDEADLADWLPWGEGRAAVLVLSEGTQRALQRRREALHLVLSPLSLEESERLLRLVGPGGLEERKVHEIVNLLGGHPSSLLLVASALRDLPVDEVLGRIQAGGDWAPPLYEHLVSALEGPRWEAVAALALGPIEGVPEDLAKALAEEEIWLGLEGEGRVLREGGKLRLGADAWRAGKARILGEPERLEVVRGRIVEVLYGLLSSGLRNDLFLCASAVLGVNEEILPHDALAARLVGLGHFLGSLSETPELRKIGTARVRSVLDQVLKDTDIKGNFPETTSALLACLGPNALLGSAADRFGPAEALVQRITSATPGDRSKVSRAYLHLSKIRLDVGLVESSREALQKAFDHADVDPERGEIHRVAAQVSAAVGDASAALDHLRQAAELMEPLQAGDETQRLRAVGTLYDLARAELKQGLVADADQHYARALQVLRGSATAMTFGTQLPLLVIVNELAQSYQSRGITDRTLDVLNENLPLALTWRGHRVESDGMVSEMLITRANLHLIVRRDLPSSSEDLREAIRTLNPWRARHPMKVLPTLHSLYPLLAKTLRLQDREAEARSIEAEAALLPPLPPGPAEHS